MMRNRTAYFSEKCCNNHLAESPKSRDWCARILCVLVCSVCLHPPVFDVPKCLRACVFICLASLRVLCPYMLTYPYMSLHACCAQISYVLACFFDVVCPILFTFGR